MQAIFTKPGTYLSRLLIIGWLLSCSGSLHASSWTLSTKLGPSVNEHAVAFDHNNNAIICWVDRLTDEKEIIAATYADGNWTKSTLSTHKYPSRPPIVSINQNGTAYVVWMNHLSKGVEIRIASYDFTNGSWNIPKEPIAHTHDGLSFSPIRFDEAGNPLFFWRAAKRDSDRHVHTIRGLKYDVQEERWRNLPELEAKAFTLNLAVDAAGNATLIWNESAGVKAATLQAGANEWIVKQLSQNSHVFHPKLAVDTHGNVVALWVKSYGAKSRHQVKGAKYSALKQRWESIDCSSLGLMQDNYHLAIDPEGRAILIWKEKRSRSRDDSSSKDENRILFSTLDTSGWKKPQMVSKAGLDDFEFCTDGQGNVMILVKTQKKTLEVFMLPKGQKWRKETIHTPSSINVSTLAALSPNGTALVGYVHETVGDRRILRVFRAVDP